MGARVQWDFDGDGKIDANGVKTVHPFPKPGRYRVTMWVTDGVFGKVHKVEQTVSVGGSK